MISKLGGVKAAITPFFALLAPCYSVLFLVKFSKLLKQKYKDYYKDQLRKQISANQKLLNLNQDEAIEPSLTSIEQIPLLETLNSKLSNQVRAQPNPLNQS
jgi:hypothetical protein